MERVRKLVSVPDDIGEGRTKVTVAVLDTGECVIVLHCGSCTAALHPGENELPSESVSEQDPIVSQAA